MKKNLFYFLLTVCALISCEEVIDVDLSSTEPQLVIDALIIRNDSLIIGSVTLTTTAPFFDNQTPAAENALVSIIDEQTGEVFNLSETETGVFDIGFPDFEFNKDYTLEVVYENQTYRATERLMETGEIDSAEQSDGFLFDPEEETEVEITFTDIVDQRNYYLFSFGFENFLVTDDEFYQNSNLTFSYFYEEVFPGDMLTIRLLGITQEFANFVNLTLVQTGENGGGPFMTPPATVRGNITNITNSDNFAFGYFSLSEFDVAFITVQ